MVNGTTQELAQELQDVEGLLNNTRVDETSWEHAQRQITRYSEMYLALSGMYSDMAADLRSAQQRLVSAGGKADPNVDKDIQAFEAKAKELSDNARRLHRSIDDPANDYQPYELR